MHFNIHNIFFKIIQQKDKITMKYAKCIHDFYNTIICSLLFFAVTMTILPSHLYAQANSRYSYIPEDWSYNKSCTKDVNKNIRITGVSFEAGPFAIRFGGLEPTYSKSLTNNQRRIKLMSAKLHEYGKFGAMFRLQHKTFYVDSSKSYTFNLNDIAPFIISEGVVYRTKRTTVNGVRVPGAPLRIEYGNIPELPEKRDHIDKVMFLNGLAAKHNYRAGYRLWLPGEPTFTDWRKSKIPADSMFMLAEQVCLVHYFPVDPSQIRSDGRVLLDKRWVQGYKDSDNRWRFIFVVAEPEGPKDKYDFY